MTIICLVAIIDCSFTLVWRSNERPLFKALHWLVNSELINRPAMSFWGLLMLPLRGIWFPFKLCTEAQYEYQEQERKRSTGGISNVSTEIPQGVPGRLMAAERCGDIGGGHRGVDGDVVGRQGGVRLRRSRVLGFGHGVASEGVGRPLRSKVGGGRHGEGGETKFTEKIV